MDTMDIVLIQQRSSKNADNRTPREGPSGPKRSPDVCEWRGDSDRGSQGMRLGIELYGVPIEGVPGRGQELTFYSLRSLNPNNIGGGGQVKPCDVMLRETCQCSHHNITA